jgi:hypothetical protein
MSKIARPRQQNIGALGWVGVGLGTAVAGALVFGGWVFYRMTKM